VVKDFLRAEKNFLSRRETNILSAAFFIMTTTAASRILGLLRDRLLAGFFGASRELGVFWAAVEIPDTIFYIMGSAVFSASFIPIFTRYLNRGEKEEGWEMAGATLKFSLVLFAVLALLIVIFPGPISHLVAPGFSPSDLRLMSSLVRVMTLAQFFFVLSYFATGVLHSFQRFLIPALAAVLYNLGVVLGILFLVPHWGIWGPAWGMVLGASLHFLVQLPLLLSLGFSFQGFVSRFFHPGVRRLIRLMIPRAIALLGNKLGLLIQIGLASLSFVVDHVSNVTVLTFARHLELLPIGLFGVSISQAALPALSGGGSEDSRARERFKEILVSSLHKIFFLTAPMAVILLVLRIPMVRLAFGAKKFSWKATILTGYTVAFFSLGVVFQAVLHLLNRAFYALEEARIPVIVSLTFSALGVVLSLLTLRVLGFGVWGIPLSFSIAAALQALVLFLLLEKHIGSFEHDNLLVPISKIGWSALFAGFALYLPLKLLDELIFDTTRTLGLLLLTGIAGSFGAATYLFFTWVLGVKETRFFFRFVLSRVLPQDGHR